MKTKGGTKPVVSFLKETVRTVLPTALITFMFLFFIGQLAVVNGRSMNDTLKDGDLVFMEKITQRFSSLSRYDIIIFDSGINNQDFIKRIIGLPEEKVQIDNEGKIFINDNLISESFGKETMVYPGIAENGIKLDEKYYFVLGDNRNNSEDSRFEEVGPINYYKIKGRVCYSLMPFGKIE